MNPHITLEQWRALLAVVDAGGYAQAAEVMHKTQSAVSYAIQKMEAVLGVKVFKVGDEAERQVYLVGKATDGRWVGLKTTVVET